MSTKSPKELYDAVNNKSKAAAEEWFAAIAPQLEESAKKWVERRDYDEQAQHAYFAVVHPLLMWRFFHHLHLILCDAADGWKSVLETLAEEQEEADGDS